MTTRLNLRDKNNGNEKNGNGVYRNESELLQGMLEMCGRVPEKSNWQSGTFMAQACGIYK